MIQCRAFAFVLAPMAANQLDEAIATPSANAAVAFDDGVLADLVFEAAAKPGSPSLLQFTLRELYERRVDGRIGVEQMAAIGWIAGSFVRRRAKRGELSTEALAVADRYVDARPLVADRDQSTREPTVEIAHDVLLTHWPRLARWIDDDNRWLVQLAPLSVSATPTFFSSAPPHAGRIVGRAGRGVGRRCGCSGSTSTR